MILQHHGLQHARLPRPSLSASVCSNSCPLNQWCHPNISSSITHFFSCSQSFPASWSFPVSQLFTSGGQNFGASASTSVLSMNIQGWFPLGLTGLISLFSKETNLSRVFCSTSIWKHQFYSAQSSLWLNSHIHIRLLEKNIALTTQIFVIKVMSLIFNTLSRFLIAFLPRRKHLLISWLLSLSSLIFKVKNMKSDTVFTFPPSICYDIIGPDSMIVVFWMLSFKSAFSLSSFNFVRRLVSSSSLPAIKVVSSAYLRSIFLLAFLIPACESSSPTFHMMCSTYKLNKQNDNMQPWHTTFPIWNQSVSCLVLPVVSWPAYRFLSRQVRYLVFPFLEEFYIVCCDPQSQRILCSQ